MRTDVNKRDTRIDILRFFAIMGIIIAHSNPPVWLSEIRNFDVPMMILMMGTSFFISNKGKQMMDYIPYVYKRFKRLIIPTWGFTTLFFILFFVFSLIIGDGFYFDLNEIIRSYATLLGGISFVWIMRVFFIISLISPFVLEVSRKIKSSVLYFFYVVLAYLVYEVSIFIGGLFIVGPFYSLYNQVVLYSFGFILFAAIGIRLLDMSTKELVGLMIISLVIFVSYGVILGFPSLHYFKYPPTAYYISYGVFISIFCFCW